MSFPSASWLFRPALPFLLLGLLFASGCATTAPQEGNRRALRHVPAVPENQSRADRAILAALFAASEAPLTDAELAQIIPAANPQGFMDRAALHRLATAKNRLLLVVKADERFLWEELGRDLPVLLLLPPDTRYSPAAPAFIPLAWDQQKQTLELLDGNGEIQTVAEDSFFARRDPLKHAALCLIKPNRLGQLQPTREQKLVLADFWYEQGFYRKANNAYTAIQNPKSTDTLDVAALLGQGNILVRKGRYKDAIPVFRSALALDPDNPRILNNLAYCLLKDGQQLLVALRHAMKADRLDPENPVILETIGSINLKIGDALAAARYLEHAWARALKRPPEIQIAIMDQLVRAWLAADRADLAWQVAEYRHRVYPLYRIPPDILLSFPILRRPAEPLPEKK